MARIQFADGTFTTREVHEVDPHVALPDNIEIVDHGEVVTTGLPANIPQTALGVEFVEVAPEPEPAPAVHHRAAPVHHPKAAPRPKAKPSAKPELKPEPSAPSIAHPPTLSHPESHMVMDTSGSVPQGRIGLETPHADWGDPGRSEHPDIDDD